MFPSFSTFQTLGLMRQMSFTFYILVAMSVIALAIGIERALFLRRALARLRDSHVQILHQLRQHGLERAQAANETLPTHSATEAYALVFEKPDIAPSVLRRTVAQILRRARSRLWILGSFGSVAPFVGLLGTVFGVMEAFRAIGSEGAGGFAVVSSGLSEALATTAAGIFVAVESVVLFNTLQVLSATYTSEIKEALEETVECIEEQMREI